MRTLYVARESADANTTNEPADDLAVVDHVVMRDAVIAVCVATDGRVRLVAVQALTVQPASHRVVTNMTEVDAERWAARVREIGDPMKVQATP